MEIKLKIKTKIEREEGPTQNQIWGILKYLSAEIFIEMQRSIGVGRHVNVGSNDTCQWRLRSKIGVWQMPLFKFLRHRDLKENFKSTGRRDLNIKYANFDQLKYWECHAYEYSYYEYLQCDNICESGEHILTVGQNW